MPINYDLLKKSEENLKKIFFNYLNDAYVTHGKLITLMEKYRDNLDVEEDFKELTKREKQADLTQVDCFEELIWDLSKDQPMLSHLRWYISVLNSIGDIERICDYFFFMAVFFRNNKNIPQKVVEKAISMNDELHFLFKGFLEEIKKSNVKKYYDKFKNLEKDYKKYCDDEIKEMAISLKNYPYETIIKFSFELHSYYRVIERLENILESFIFIHDTEFFRDKIEREEQF